MSWRCGSALGTSQLTKHLHLLQHQWWQELCLPRKPGLGKSSHIKINRALSGCYSAGHKSNWGDTDETSHGKFGSYYLNSVFWLCSFFSVLPSLCCFWCWRQLHKHQDLWLLFWFLTPNLPLSVAVNPDAPKGDHHYLWRKEQESKWAIRSHLAQSIMWVSWHPKILKT